MPSRRSFLQTCAALPLLPLIAQPSLGAPVVKVFLDTDIGSDIDDAVALAYLLRQPRCELLGITTVTGQAAQRVRLARALCDAAGINIPVLAGYETPLLIKQRQLTAPQAEKLTPDKGLSAHQQTGPEDAIDLMRQTIRRHPGEIVLLAVGPLTNIARLFQIDPEIPTLIKRLVIMGGKYSDFPTPWGPTEWNAIVDPHATDIVFKAAATKITAFGLDITWQVSMTPEEVQTRFAIDPILKIVRNWSDVWFRDRELLHFHDPLAAAAIFDPDICEYQRGEVSVALDTPQTAGITHFRPRSRGPVTVAKSVSPDLFFNAYFEHFKRVAHKQLSSASNLTVTHSS